MLGCGVVRHPGGMVKGESRLEGFLRIKAKGLHDGVCLLRKATSLQEYRLAGRPGTICDARSFPLAGEQNDAARRAPGLH